MKSDELISAPLDEAIAGSKTSPTDLNAIHASHAAWRAFGRGVIICVGWFLLFFPIAAFCADGKVSIKRVLIAFIIALHGGAIATAILHIWLHKLLKKNGNPVPRSRSHERHWWLPVTLGLYERTMIIFLVGFNVSAAAAFIGAWIALKSASGWKDWSTGTAEGRARVLSATLISGVSALFGVIGGLLIRTMAQ